MHPYIELINPPATAPKTFPMTITIGSNTVLSLYLVKKIQYVSSRVYVVVAYGYAINPPKIELTATKPALVKPSLQTYSERIYF